MGESLFVYSGMVIYGGYLWYESDYEGVLFRVSLKDGSSEYIGAIPGAEGQLHAYRNMVIVDESIYFIPFSKKKICKYNIKAETFELIDLPDDICGALPEKPHFYGAILYGDKIITYSINGLILIYDTSDLKFKLLDVRFFFNDTTYGEWFWRGGFIEDDYVHIPLIRENVFFNMNMINGEKSLSEFDSGVNSLAYSIPFSYKKSWGMVSIDKDWKVVVNVYESFNDSVPYKRFTFKVGDGNKSGLESPFLWGEVLGDELVLTPGYSTFLYRVNLSTGAILSEEVSDNKTGFWNTFCGAKLDDRQINTIISGENEGIILSYDGNLTKKITISLNNETINEIRKNRLHSLKSGGCLVEQKDIFELLDFVSIIASR